MSMTGHTPSTTVWRGAPTAGERLLLAALRAWVQRRVAGERPQESVAHGLAALGSVRVAALFVAWMQAVEQASRRVLLIHCPHAVDMSADEQRLIAACGAAPVTQALGEILLQPLLLDCGAVIGLGKALNAAMAVEGYPLPARLTISPFESDSLSGPTLH